MYDAAPDLTSLVIEGLEEKPASGFVALDKLSIGVGGLQTRASCGSETAGLGLEVAAAGTFGSCEASWRRRRICDSSHDRHFTGMVFGTLRQFARRERPLERCELCSVGLRPDHPHLIEVAQRKLLCTCEACAILFSGRESSSSACRGGYARFPASISATPSGTA